MKNTFRRITSVILTLIMVITFATPTVFAQQSDIDSYSQSYTLTGNPADDIVAVAAAQVGKSGADIGYAGRAWCAFFVCDCAKLAGISDSVIPYNYSKRGSVGDLYSYMMNNCGATEVAKPQKGDLVFYYCTTDNGFCHVGIMSDSVNSIQGNLYDSVMNIPYDYYRDSKGNGACYTVKFVRPSYSANSSPADTIRAGEKIQIYTQWDVESYGSVNGRWMNGSGCGWFSLGHALQWLGIIPRDHEGSDAAIAQLYAESGYISTVNRRTDAESFLQNKYTNLSIQSYSSKSVVSILQEGGVALYSRYGHIVVAVALSSDENYVHIVDSCLYIPYSKNVNVYQYNETANQFEQATIAECAARNDVYWYCTDTTSSSMAKASRPHAEYSGGDYWIPVSEVSSSVINYVDGIYNTENTANDVVVTWSEYSKLFSIEETNAVVAVRIDMVGAYSTDITENTIYFYDKDDNLLIEHTEPVNLSNVYTWSYIYYNCHDELGLTLTPGTTYKYKIGCKILGKYYFDEVRSFTTLGEATLTGITVNTLPDKTVYNIGEALDTTGLTLTATYSNGTTNTITSGFTVSGFSSETAGEKTITVTYGGKTATFAVTVNPNVSQDSPKIVISSGKAAPGKQVFIDVYLEKNPGISYLKITPSFDASAMTLKEIKTDRADLKFDSVTLGTNILFDNAANVTGDGLLCTLVFEIDENAAEGDYTINLIFRQACDYNEDLVTFIVNAGKVTVSAIIYGDANNDGVIDGRDLIRLRRYLVDYNEDTGSSSVIITAGADCNGDDIIDGRDLIRLRKYLALYDEDTGTSPIVLGP